MFCKGGGGVLDDLIVCNLHTLLYAGSISTWSNQGSVLFFVVHSEPIEIVYIYLIIQLELWILQSALSVNGKIYFYWNCS